MRIKLLLVFLLSINSLSCSWAPAFFAFLNQGTKYTFMGFTLNPGSLAVAGGCVLAKEVIDILLKEDPNKLPTRKVTKNKRWHIFGGDNRKKHNFDREDSSDMLKEAYNMIDEEKARKAIKEGPQVINKMIRHGIRLVVKICALSNGIDIATMYIQKVNCKEPNHVGSHTTMKPEAKAKALK